MIKYLLVKIVYQFLHPLFYFLSLLFLTLSLTPPSLSVSMYFSLTKFMIYYHLFPSTLLRSTLSPSSQNHSPKGQGASSITRGKDKPSYSLSTHGWGPLATAHSICCAVPHALGPEANAAQPASSNPLHVAEFPHGPSAVSIGKVYMLLFLPVCSVSAGMKTFPMLTQLWNSCKGISSGNKGDLKTSEFLEVKSWVCCQSQVVWKVCVWALEGTPILNYQCSFGSAVFTIVRDRANHTLMLRPSRIHLI